MSDELKLNRRQMLKALAGAAICPMAAGCEFAEVFDGEAVEESTFHINDSGYQNLAEVGGTACHDHGNRLMLLVRTDEDTVVAFDRICPHQNLDMGGNCGDQPRAEWNPNEGVIECQWHGSRFDTDGNFVTGPDPQDTPDIPTFPVDFDPVAGTGTISIDEP